MQHLVELVEDTYHNVAARDCHLNVGDTIKWLNPTGTEFNIHFAKGENPFLGNDFKVPAKPNGAQFGEVDSPALNPKVGDNVLHLKKFHYDLLPPAGSSFMAADPVVIVHID